MSDGASSGVSVSVVIPTYNRAQSVGRAIESVLGQSCPPDQVIVVNDGSTDATPDVLRGYGDAIEVVDQANQGASKARNAGCQRAVGDWITFLDSDDVWDVDRLAVLQRDIAQAPQEVGVHIAGLLFVGPNYSKTLYDERGVSFEAGEAILLSDPLTITLPGFSLVSSAIRRSSFEKAGGLDESLSIYEDLHLLSVLALAGPFLATGDVVARCERLEGDEAALTTLEKKRAVIAKSNLADAYKDLLSKARNGAQRQLIRRVLSGALFDLARVQWVEDRTSAKAALFDGARQHPNPLKGFAKAVGPLIAGEGGFVSIGTARQSLDRG